ncbi:flagellar hook-basal body complex protein FliE [Wansuia hejianensis]|uniref:Flagellar hook-basal body complex protein FliE n=1 Tax=Wansuia hejianensis TaxID=2763667 RepID=A0A926F1P4_9FIRM|nr:flagellar hook-basal body complex protein FliE [Wansuia hejianensis]MBC8590305.1 flagellar hook-basal body complex protein FliE [Wansuia hejianensis]
MNILSMYKDVLGNATGIINNTTFYPNSQSIEEDKKISFKDIIDNEMDKLNNRQIYADKKIQEFISGQSEDLHSVMIATEEARLSLELAVQVRNKCIEAIKEINNMQL